MIELPEPGTKHLFRYDGVKNCLKMLTYSV